MLYVNTISCIFGIRIHGENKKKIRSTEIKINYVPKLCVVLERTVYGQLQNNWGSAFSDFISEKNRRMCFGVYFVTTNCEFFRSFLSRHSRYKVLRVFSVNGFRAQQKIHV